MLKDFWEEKKHVIQFVGILTAVGALFLSIPAPADEGARIALQHIQFIWMLIISISAVILLTQLWILVRALEKTTKDKAFNFDETITLILMAGIVYFILNLLIYGKSLYHDAFFNFFGSFAGYGVGALLGALGYSSWRWVLLGSQKVKQPFLACISFGTMLLICSVAAAWFNFVSHKGLFPLRDWLTLSALIFGAILVVIFGTYMYKKYRPATIEGK